MSRSARAWRGRIAAQTDADGQRQKIKAGSHLPLSVTGPTTIERERLGLPEPQALPEPQGLPEPQAILRGPPALREPQALPGPQGLPEPPALREPPRRVDRRRQTATQAALKAQSFA